MRTTCCRGDLPWENGEESRATGRVHFWQPSMGQGYDRDRAGGTTPSPQPPARVERPCTRPHISRSLWRRVTATARQLNRDPEALIAEGIELVERREKYRQEDRERRELGLGGP